MNKFRIWDKELKRWCEGMLLNQDGKVSSTHPEHYIVVPYVGWKDSEDNEIYEGDIVQMGVCSDNDELFCGVVRYCDHLCYWVVGTETVFSVAHYAENKVIGNIYENPELLREI